MSRIASSPRWIPAALACLAVAACTPAQQPSRSEEAQYDACRRHADLVDAKVGAGSYPILCASRRSEWQKQQRGDSEIQGGS